MMAFVGEPWLLPSAVRHHLPEGHNGITVAQPGAQIHRSPAAQCLVIIWEGAIRLAPGHHQQEQIGAVLCGGEMSRIG